jgi:hypothetical protein
MKHGGKRIGSGRKSKAEEHSLVEKLSPLEPLAFIGLKDALIQKKEWAVKLTFEYLFGKPKQYIQQEIEQTISSNDLGKFINIPEQTILDRISDKN